MSYLRGCLRWLSIHKINAFREKSLLGFFCIVALALFPYMQISADASMHRGEVWGFPVKRGMHGSADGGVVKFFIAPPAPWGSGHRGIDIAVRPGSVVQAVAGGTVTMSGAVAGANSVVVRHSDGSRSGYSFLLAMLVEKGEKVTKGEALGISGGTGPGHLNPGVLHLSWRVGEQYRDPLSRLAPRAWHFAP